MAWSPYRNDVQNDSSANGSSTTFSNLFFVALLIFGAFFVYHKIVPNGPPSDDDTVIVDPIDNDEAVQLKDSYIVRVYESEAEETPTWMIKLLDADSFWFDWLNEQGMQYATIDPGSDKEKATTFLAAAKKRGIEPPFFLHAAKGGNVLSVTPFTESLTIDEYKSILKKGK